MRKYPVFILVSALAAVIAVPTAAQETGSEADNADSNIEISVNSDDEFADEGLNSSDLSDGVEAQVLPDEPFKFGWESAWFNIRRAFTVSAERKAALDRLRLHQLDIKLAACAELGDEECMGRIEERISDLERKANDFLQRREDLKERLQERFSLWRSKRNERIEELRERAGQRRDRLEQLYQERQENLEELRQERQQENREVRRDILGTLQAKKEEVKKIEETANENNIRIESNLDSGELDDDGDGVVNEVIEKEVTSDSAHVKLRQEINANNNESVNSRVLVNVSTDDAADSEEE